jgi:hypothetical protein
MGNLAKFVIIYILLFAIAYAILFHNFTIKRGSTQVEYKAEERVASINYKRDISDSLDIDRYNDYITLLQTNNTQRIQSSLVVSQEILDKQINDMQKMYSNRIISTDEFKKIKNRQIQQQKEITKNLEILNSAQKEIQKNLNKINPDSLTIGEVAYKIPDTMIVGNNYRSIVTISNSFKDSILYEGLKSPGFKKEIIQVSSIIKLSIIDPIKENFEITALSSEEQVLKEGSNTVWSWTITPKKNGSNLLILRATVKLKSKDGESFKDIDVLERLINVKSSLISDAGIFWKEHWEWMITTFILPIITFFFVRLFPKKPAT